MSDVKPGAGNLNSAVPNSSPADPARTDDFASPRPLKVEDGQAIYEAFRSRRERWADEDEFTALMVVLFNFGDRLTGVSCTAGEWSGVKGDLPPRDGIPLCPNGHPLFESPNRWRLGMVPEVLEVPS